MTLKWIVVVININNALLVEDIQKEFSRNFPNLKIQFYLAPHGIKKLTSYDDCVSPKTTIGATRRIHKAGTIEIKSADTVEKVEKCFKKFFGLDVQVFRNENNAWIPTTATDDCTLKEQDEFCEHAKVSIYPKSAKQLKEYRFSL